jgi:hypothetical protein
MYPCNLKRYQSHVTPPSADGSMIGEKNTHSNILYIFFLGVEGLCDETGGVPEVVREQ